MAEQKEEKQTALEKATQENTQLKQMLEANKTADQKAFELVQREAKALASSQLIPKNFQNNIPDCIIAIEMAKRIGAAPLAVLQNIYIVHGKPSWSSQFMIAIVNTCGRFNPLKFHYEGQGDQASCVAYTSYKDEPEKNIKGPKVTINMAKKEGWMSKNGSKWQTMPELMLSYRSATFFARMYCPDLLMGMRSMDELQDIKANEEKEEQTTVKSDLFDEFEVDDK